MSAACSHARSGNEPKELSIGTNPFLLRTPQHADIKTRHPMSHFATPVIQRGLWYHYQMRSSDVANKLEITQEGDCLKSFPKPLA